MNRILFLGALLLALSACEATAPVSSADLSEPLGSPDAVDSFVTGDLRMIDPSASDEAMRTAVRESSAIFFGVSGGTNHAVLLRSQASLDEKDRAATALFAEYTGPKWTLLRQMAAVQLLELHQRADSRDLDAIDRYTRVLVEGRNPDAGLIAWALDRLDGRWTDSQREGAAQATHEAAERWLADNCADCLLGRTSERSAATGAPARKAATIAEGLGVLAELADA